MHWNIRRICLWYDQNDYGCSKCFSHLPLSCGSRGGLGSPARLNTVIDDHCHRKCSWSWSFRQIRPHGESSVVDSEQQLLTLPLDLDRPAYRFWHCPLVLLLSPTFVGSLPAETEDGILSLAGHQCSAWQMQCTSEVSGAIGKPCPFHPPTSGRLCMCMTFYINIKFKPYLRI